MEKETIMIDGVRYYADRPKSCRGCFFWKNRKAGCSLKKENCYYLAESPKKNSPCKGCCYAPCVSFCMKKCMNSGPEQDGSEMQAVLLLSSGLQVQEMSVRDVSLR